MMNQKRRMRRKNLKKMTMMMTMMMNTQRQKQHVQKQNVQKQPGQQLEQTNKQANLKKQSLDPHLVLLRKCHSDVSYHVCVFIL